MVKRHAQTFRNVSSRVVRNNCGVVDPSIRIGRIIDITRQIRTNSLLCVLLVMVPSADSFRLHSSSHYFIPKSNSQDVLQEIDFYWNV